MLNETPEKTIVNAESAATLTDLECHILLCGRDSMEDGLEAVVRSYAPGQKQRGRGVRHASRKARYCGWLAYVRTEAYPDDRTYRVWKTTAKGGAALDAWHEMVWAKYPEWNQKSTPHQSDTDELKLLPEQYGRRYADMVLVLLEMYHNFEETRQAAFVRR
jgi:hypothetical protein